MPRVGEEIEHMPNGEARSLAIAPLAFVSRVGGVDDSSLWKSLSDHPQLLLAGAMPWTGRGTTLFEVDLLPIAGCAGGASLCFDFGAGFDERDRVPLRPTPLSAKMLSAAVRFSSRPRRIRLDPCMGPGEFLCSAVRVSAISRARVVALGEEPARMPLAGAGSEYARVATSPVPVPQEALRDPSRIGAILHLFYEDLWPEMSQYLARIPSIERVYVSIPESASRDLEERIAAAFPNVLVQRHPNRGRDVLPFLHWLEVAAHEGVELVCKIHTKRSPHVPRGDAWRRDILDKLLGSEQAVREIVSSFHAHPALGIVAPGGHLVPSSYFWERNAARVEELCLRVGYDVRGVAFDYVAGSMFWARVEALLPLRRLGLRDADFEDEAGLVDGTTAHALERCFPIAARVAGFTIGESANAEGTTLRDFAP
jgi:hypothetical protein